jgi:hypothetical protein
MINVTDELVEKIKTHILCSVFFFPPKSCRFRDSVEKYSRFRQATHDHMICCMCFACWITEASDTHAENVIFIAFPRH